MEDSRWTIIESKEIDDGWCLAVSLADLVFEVTIDRRYAEDLIGQGCDLEKAKLLVDLSFEFLLERESPSAILKRFNLEDIRIYFPEYEKEIRQKFLN